MATIRELRRREKCRPSLNREFEDILIGSECSGELEGFLRERGFRVSSPVEAATGVDLIEIGGSPDLDEVEAAIQQWKNAD
ncbi:hypothetical protein Spa11_14150 [Botrimarina mediterranea]|uniref:Uncharacterized protein n=1 Tax=Botrimarina mediterranea TaxID=2528022 RepID=A0A518K609_9BACT|nr:hypothetical protein Spa11_14150 [Botrimarina mediterranea]